MFKKQFLLSVTCLLLSAPLYANVVLVRQLNINDQYIIRQQADKLVITDNDTKKVITIDRDGGIQPPSSMERFSSFGGQSGKKMPLALSFSDSEVTIYFGASVSVFGTNIQVAAGSYTPTNRECPVVLGLEYRKYLQPIS